MMETMRLGILGAARIAADAVVGPASLTGVRLAAIAARDMARAQEFAAAHNVERVIETYAELIADAHVDAIYNPLVNSLHTLWNLAAMGAGKHVLSEKPLASNAREAQVVATAARDSDLVVAEGFHYVYHPMLRRVQELLDSGEVGELRRVHARVVIPPPPPQDPRWSLSLSGGALMDLGCYGLHVHRMLGPWAKGEPRLLTARGEERAGGSGVDEWVDAELIYPSGASGRAYCSMAGQTLEMTLSLECSSGVVTVKNFVLPHVDDRLLVSTRDGRRIERLGTRSSYVYQLQAFANSLSSGEPLPTRATDSVATMQLIDDCYRMIGFEPRQSGEG